MSALLETPLLRILLLGLLVLILQVPATMIGRLGQERAQARADAAAEIATHWGGRQELVGPLLVVPCGSATVQGWSVDTAGAHVVSPEELHIDATARTEQRRRGLFEVPVYRAQLHLSGHFSPATALPDCASPDWQAAQLVVRLSDVHALDDVAPLRWAGQPRNFEPGAGALAGSGVHVSSLALAAEPVAFEVTLTLRGSDGLFFAPLGLETAATLESAWPDPAFQGAWLPAVRDVAADGFTARWRIPHVARGLPPAWKLGTLGDEALKASLFGASFLAPVDPYRMIERSLKYCTLIIGLTFVLVWLCEVAGGARVHPVQYLMLGAALCLFYLLELSLSEHLGFGPAYALASAMVTTQVTLYGRATLGGSQPALLFAGVTALYGVLYVLLREDDYALLAGSLCLFGVLSAVMFTTRRLRWGAGSGEAAAPQ